MLARRRAQPTALSVARLTLTAVFAYLLALLVPGAYRPVLAPLTALLVAQVSVYQTVRSAVQRVAAVIAGVLLAIALNAVVGFTWWSLGAIIAAALAIGHALRLGDSLLEVPISAMLILSLDTRAQATGRIIDTLIGTAAGLIAGLVVARPRLQPAEEAIEELSGRMAALLDDMAAGLGDGSGERKTGEWLSRARALGSEIARVEQALAEAEDSTRLNPRSLLYPRSVIELRTGVETLEHLMSILRVMARSLADSSQLEDEASPVREHRTRAQLAAVLGTLAAAVRAYGRLIAADPALSRDPLEEDLKRQLSAARDLEAELAESLRADPAIRPVGWPLRGELLTHLDRFRGELQAGWEPALRPRPRRRERSWQRPMQAGRRRARASAQRLPGVLRSAPFPADPVMSYQEALRPSETQPAESQPTESQPPPPHEG
jgi:uncharacterized membrane protein YgaE (UPF0421/DUF939 family)